MIVTALTPGGAMRANERGDTCGLPQRQRAVLALVATGLTSDEVSRVLRVPVQDVRGDMQSVMRTLGARSKLEAVVIALRDRLIQLPQDVRPRLVQRVTPT